MNAPIFFNKFSKNITIADGRGNYTFEGDITGILMHIIVRANSDSTTFDFQLYDKDDVVVYEDNDVEGGINEQVMIPLDGTYTMSVSDSSADEVFRFYLMIREF